MFMSAPGLNTGRLWTHLSQMARNAVSFSILTSASVQAVIEKYDLTDELEFGAGHSTENWPATLPMPQAECALTPGFINTSQNQEPSVGQNVRGSEIPPALHGGSYQVEAECLIGVLQTKLYHPWRQTRCWKQHLQCPHSLSQMMKAAAQNPQLPLCC